MRASGLSAQRLDMAWECSPGQMDQYTRAGGTKTRLMDKEDLFISTDRCMLARGSMTNVTDKVSTTI